MYSHLKIDIYIGGSEQNSARQKVTTVKAWVQIPLFGLKGSEIMRFKVIFISIMVALALTGCEGFDSMSERFEVEQDGSNQVEEVLGEGEAETLDPGAIFNGN